MRKTILWSGVSAVILAYLLISWRLGFAIEKQINGQLDQAMARTPYLEVVTNTFRRGWFRSDQDLTLQLSPKLAAPGAAAIFSAPIQIKIHNVIWHGPICGLTCVGLARVRTHLIFGAPLQGYLDSAFGSAEPLRIESRLSFGGGGAATLTSPAVKDTVLPDGAHISWGGLTFSSTFDAGYNAYSLQGSIPKIAFAGHNGSRVEFDDIDLAVNAKRALRTLFQGDSSMSVGRMSISDAKTGTAVLNTLQVGYKTVLNDGYMNFQYATRVGPISVSSVNFSEAHFDFALNHMETESLEQLTAAMRKVNQDSSLPPAQRGMQMLAALKEPGIRFLSHEPRLDISRFSIASSGGAASLNGSMTANGIAASDFEAGADTKALIQKLNVDLDLSLDDGFLNGLPNGARLNAQLQAFAAQGLATHVNGKFHSKITFHQGMMSFDGKTFPRPAAPVAPAPAPR